MKKMLVIVLMFSSCTSKYNEGDFNYICIDGVEYIIKGDATSHHGFMSGHFNIDGSLHTCKNKG